VALALVERFHAFSSHSRAGVFLRAPGVDWGDPTPPFKRYPGAQRIALPPATSAVGRAFGVATLGTVLWHANGVSEVRSGLRLRTSPSSGALFPAELYVVASAVPGLARGVWHYDPDGHALERIGDAVGDAAGAGAGDEASSPDAAALVVATGVFRRTGHKYRDRTYRYVLADLGHALENLRAAGAAVGVDVRFLAAFDEARTAGALGIDAAEEGVLAIGALHADPDTGGRPERPPTQPAVPRWQAPDLVGENSAPLGVTAAVHAATSLQSSVPGRAAIPPTASPSADLPVDAIVLPRADPTRADVLQVIARRRSMRRFARTPLPRQDLAAVLARMSGPRPVWSPALRIDVVVHGVEALAPGSYRYEPVRHALLPRRVGADLRDAARAAALDQDVIGDAAVALVLSIDRAAFAADPLGAARGYRHAFLEAGLAGERIYLEAGARGLGVCAVGAFYDDEAARLVGVDPAREWVVHFAGLGVPA
ncbi:MAG TPA: SagB/ThcOx family dehydrogenase, partial [Caldimonas sp.]